MDFYLKSYSVSTISFFYSVIILPQSITSFIIGRDYIRE